MYVYTKKLKRYGKLTYCLLDFTIPMWGVATFVVTLDWSESAHVSALAAFPDVVRYGTGHRFF